MDLSQVEAFLVLADELHFGRTADRLHVSQSRVSRLIASLERDIGGRLFDRTSRRVRLTPLGVLLHARLAPAREQLSAAFTDARRAAREPAGVLRIGFTLTTEEKIASLAAAFEAGYPDCRVELIEVPAARPYDALRSGETDVLVSWLELDEPDLTAGPVIQRMDRVLAVAATHPLAACASVSIEDVADHQVRTNPPDAPRALFDTLIPRQTPTGRPIPRASDTEFRSVHELIAQIARAQVVHPTVDIHTFRGHRGITLVPIRDLPPLRLGLIWCTAHENERIRAFARVAPAAALTRPMTTSTQRS